jgi:dihydrofolate reductase
MVIGGAQIYALALPRAARLELTEVALDVPDADAWFPEIDRDMWRVVGSEAIRTESAIELNFYTMIKNNY